MDLLKNLTQREYKMKPLTMHTKKTIAAGAASVAVVAALGIGAVFAHGANTKPAETPTQTPSAITQAKEETKTQLTAQDVADATTSLAYAGDDVSASDNVSVSVKDGHVMVKETSEDTAANNVWYAPRRAAALAKRLNNTSVKADSEDTSTDIKDVTWVVADKDDNVQIAVVDTPDSKAATNAGTQTPLPKAEEAKEADNTASKPADDKSGATDDAGTTNASDDSTPSTSENANTTENTTTDTPAPETEKPKTSDVLNGSDGYTMNTETHDGLPDEEKDKVGESGGKTVTDPDGNAIEPSKPAPAPTEEVKPEEPTAPVAPKTPSVSTDTPTPSNNGNSDSSTSYTPSTPSAPREKKPVYRTETRYVVDKPAWSEQVFDHDEYVFSDGAIFYDDASAWQYMKKTELSYSVRDVYKTVYHEEQGHTEEYQVLDHYE